MLDLLRITIPFKAKAVICAKDVLSADEAIKEGYGGELLNLLTYTSQGLRVRAHSVYLDAEGNLCVAELSHPFDSLPSSFSGIAIKICTGTDKQWPHISMKASPAKAMQGHNIYGGSSILQAAIEFLGTLEILYPSLYADLDVDLTQVTNLDVTYSARYASIGSPIGHQTGRDLIKCLRNVSAGQLMPDTSRVFETTTYWGSAESQLSRLKAYLKDDEVLADLKAAKAKRDPLSRRLVKVLSNKQLQDWATFLIRLEASFLKDWLRRNEIPLNLFDLIQHQIDCEKQGRCFLRELWLKKTAPLFAAFEGQTMKILDDNAVLKKLMFAHGKEMKSGAMSYSYSNTLFSFYRDLKTHGYKTVRKDYLLSEAGKRKFSRYVSDIVEAGIDVC